MAGGHAAAPQDHGPGVRWPPAPWRRQAPDPVYRRRQARTLVRAAVQLSTGADNGPQMLFFIFCFFNLIF